MGPLSMSSTQCIRLFPATEAHDVGGCSLTLLNLPIESKCLLSVKNIRQITFSEDKEHQAHIPFFLIDVIWPFLLHQLDGRNYLTTKNNFKASASTNEFSITAYVPI